MSKRKVTRKVKRYCVTCGGSGLAAIWQRDKLCRSCEGQKYSYIEEKVEEND